MGILVVFGSKTNKPVYDRVCSELKKLKADYEFRIASAHKTPHLLDEILKKNHPAIIAGAGMAAHLAGVIASKTTTPIIGVPCSDNFEGLDALLSTIQMPPGIPVLTVGVDCAEEAASAAAKISEGFSKAAIIRHARAEKCENILGKLNVPFDIFQTLQKDRVNIRLVDLNKSNQAESNGCLVINCPISESATAQDSLKLREAKKGLWVGLNRFENAALATAEILKKGKELEEYRKAIASAVLQADKEEKSD